MRSRAHRGRELDQKRGLARERSAAMTATAAAITVCAWLCGELGLVVTGDGDAGAWAAAAEEALAPAPAMERPGWLTPLDAATRVLMARTRRKDARVTVA